MYNGARIINAAGASFVVETSGTGERYLNWYGGWGSLPRIINNGYMALAPVSAVLPLPESTPLLPPPFLPHAPPALLVAGVGEGDAGGGVPAT